MPSCIFTLSSIYLTSGTIVVSSANLLVLYFIYSFSSSATRAAENLVVAALSCSSMIDKRIDRPKKRSNRERPPKGI